MILSKVLLLIKEQQNLHALVSMSSFGIQQAQVHVMKRHITAMTFLELISIRDQHNLHALVLMENGTQKGQVLVMKWYAQISLMKQNAMLLRNVSLLSQNVKIT